MELSMLAGAAVGWLLRKARRVGGRADAEVDRVLDVGMDRLQEAIDRRLAGNPAVEKLMAGNVTSPDAPLAQQVKFAVLEVLEADPEFATELRARIAELSQAAARVGDTSVTVVGNIDAYAEGGSFAAGVNTGAVTINPPRPGLDRA